MASEGTCVSYSGYFSQFEGWTVSLLKDCFCESLSNGGGCGSCCCCCVEVSIGMNRATGIYCGACSANANGSKRTCRLCSEEACEKDSGADL